MKILFVDLYFAGIGFMLSVAVDDCIREFGISKRRAAGLSLLAVLFAVTWPFWLTAVFIWELWRIE